MLCQVYIFIVRRYVDIHVGQDICTCQENASFRSYLLRLGFGKRSWGLPCMNVVPTRLVFSMGKLCCRRTGRLLFVPSHISSVLGTCNFVPMQIPLPMVWTRSWLWHWCSMWRRSNGRHQCSAFVVCGICLCPTLESCDRSFSGIDQILLSQFM